MEVSQYPEYSSSSQIVQLWKLAVIQRLAKVPECILSCVGVVTIFFSYPPSCVRLMAGWRCWLLLQLS